MDRCTCENGTSSVSDSTTYWRNIGRKYSKNVRMCALIGKLRRSVLLRCVTSRMPTTLSAALIAASQRQAMPCPSIANDNSNAPRHNAKMRKRDGSSLSMTQARIIGDDASITVGRSGSLLRAEAVLEYFVVVQLPPVEQIGERLRLVRGNALPGLVGLIDAMAAVARADFAGLKFDPVAFAHDGRAGRLRRRSARRCRSERLPYQRPLRRHE